MRIGIVNDLKLACEALRRAVLSGGEHTVAWIAHDGQQAVEQAKRDPADLILMDLIMPEVDGVEATRRIMAEQPCPILVVTSTVSGNITKVYEAMGLGALDATETPSFSSAGELQGAKGLLEKIDRMKRLCEPRSALKPAKTGTTEIPVFAPSQNFPKLVLIGASTGGPNVLAELLEAFPKSLDAAVIIAQHVDEDYAAGLADWLKQRCRMPLRMAAVNELPTAGFVYLAASHQHLVLGTDRRMRYVAEPAGWYRPSVDALFQSVARVWPNTGVAVLLTGMGTDGALGLLALHKAGWCTIAQDRESSVVWGMPKAAVEMHAAQKVLAPPDMLPSILAGLAKSQSVMKPPSRK